MTLTESIEQALNDSLVEPDAEDLESKWEAFYNWHEEL